MVIVGFGSSLDIAAIQFGSSDEVDSEQELLTVGLANLVAGLAGTGFTGSYIFTLTLFNMKNKVSSKAQGIVIVAFEVAFFMLPFSLMDYLPKFFFASFLVYFGVEIMYEWLMILSIKKVGYGEFAFLQLTFLACFLGGNSRRRSTCGRRSSRVGPKPSSSLQIQTPARSRARSCWISARLGRTTHTRKE